jgi:predicted transcriptional regulator
MTNEQLVELTADIVSAHVANNTVSVSDVANLVQRVHEALASLGVPAAEPQQDKVPVVSIRSSIKPDHLVCMECGRKQKTLKRHLQNAHGMSPDQYRADYGLPRDYPMVAPDYSKRRSEMAQAIGLGRRPRGDEAGTPAAKPAGRPRGRKPGGE